MVIRLIWISLFLFPVLLSGCQRPQTLEHHSTDDFVVEQNDGLQNRKIRFSQSLLGVSSKEHFLIGFRFLDSDSHLILQSHFSGFSLSDGVKLDVYQEDKKLMMKVSTPGFPERSAVELSDLSGSDEIWMRFEIHDGVSSGVRILVWEDTISYQGEVVRRQDRIYLGNQIFDSLAENWSFLSHGRGMFWGLELKDTLLISAHREAAYVE